MSEEVRPRRRDEEGGSDVNARSTHPAVIEPASVSSRGGSGRGWGTGGVLAAAAWAGAGVLRGRADRAAGRVETES